MSFLTSRHTVKREECFFLILYMDEKMINWHRLFGLALTDFFTESAWVVELEKDLSLKRQLLDVVILRKEKGTN